MKIIYYKSISSRFKLSFFLLFFLFPFVANTQINLRNLSKQALNKAKTEVKRETVNFASQKLSKEIAGLMGFTPVLTLSRSDRSLSASQRNLARQAQLIYSTYGPITSQRLVDNEWETQLDRARAVTRHYDHLTDDDIIAIEQAFAPLLDEIEQEVARLESSTSSYAMTIPPGQKRSLVFQGYCLDKGIAAPRTQEKLQLLPVENLLPANSMPYYTGLLEYGHRSGRHYEVQGLIWRLIHGVNPEHEPTPLSQSEQAILNEAVPGGANSFYGFLQSSYNKSHNSLNALYQRHAREFVQDALNQYVNPAFAGSGVVVDMYRYDLNSPVQIQDYLYRLSQIPVQGTADPYSEYTLLADQVAARSISTNGVQEMTVEIVNLSDEYYVYDPTQYVGFSTRQTQPVAHYPKEPTVEEESFSEQALEGAEQILKFFQENPELLEYAGYTIDGLLLFSGGGVAVLGIKAAAKALLKNPRRLKELWEAFLKVEAKSLKKGPVLPSEVVKNFRNGIYTNRQLSKPEIFYRYHGVNNRTGQKFSWLTRNKYQSEAQLRKDLAIREDWGVKITNRTKIEAPGETWVSEGIAAPQGAGYPGGGYQATISNVPRNWILETKPAF